MNKVIYLLFLIIMLTLFFIIYKKNKIIIKKNKIIEKKDTKNTIVYNNIYDLAPYQYSSLSPLDIEKKKNLINQINNYPYKINYNPKWSCKWNNNSNNILCFIDKHLNRKCIWTC